MTSVNPSKSNNKIIDASNNGALLKGSQWDMNDSRSVQTKSKIRIQFDDTAKLNSNLLPVTSKMDFKSTVKYDLIYI